LWADVDFPTKSSKGWGEVALSDVLDAIDCVGFSATLQNYTDGPVDSSNADADCYVRIDRKLHPIIDAKEINTVLMAVDGVLSLNINCDKSLVKVWGFADPDGIVETLNSHGYPSVKYLSEAAAIKGYQSERPVTQPSRIVDSSSETTYIASIHVKDKNILQDKFETLFYVNPAITKVRYATLTGNLEVYFDSKFGYNAENVMATLLEANYSCKLEDVFHINSEKYTKKNKEYKFKISGMSCANCAIKIEKSLALMPGVVKADVSCMTNVGVVVIDDSCKDAVGPRTVAEKVESLGYYCQYIPSDAKGNDTADKFDDVEAWKRLLIIAAVLGIPVIILHVSMLTSTRVMDLSMNPAVCNGGVTMGQFAMALLNTPLQIVVGYRFYRGALIGAMHGSFGMDCLVVTGTTITFVYSAVQLMYACYLEMPSMHLFFETSGMLLLFVTLGKFLEAYARKSTVSAMTSLLALQPQKVSNITNLKLFCSYILVCRLLL
jgi:copper chaperone CopZ